MEHLYWVGWKKKHIELRGLENLPTAIVFVGDDFKYSNHIFKHFAPKQA